MNGYNHMNGNGNGNGSGPSHNTNTFENVQIPTGPTNQPRVLIRQLDDMEAVFNLSGVETGYANSLRRVIMADVPTICMSHMLWFPASSCLSIFTRSSPSGLYLDWAVESEYGDGIRELGVLDARPERTRRHDANSRYRSGTIHTKHLANTRRNVGS